MHKLFNRVLVIGFVWPEPSSSAAGKRMMQLLEFLSGESSEMIVASTARRNEHTADLESLGYRCRAISVNDSGFDELLKNYKPDAVLFDRFMTEEQFGWRVSDVCPGAVRILDTEDLHCLRKARESLLKSGDDRLQISLTSDLAKREIASIFRSDLSLIISESEMLLLQSFFKVSNDILHYIPYLMNPVTREHQAGWPGFSERSGFMTIGNFRHKPNLDGVNYLRRDIWPQIRKELPDAVMNVYGSYPSQQAKEWHKPEQGFYIRGRADDANEVMRQSRLCLAPLRFGAGLKGKLVEAMINGTPSITTSMGAEGISGDHDWPGAVEDDPAKFASACVKYYTDETLWNEASSKGAEIINSRFSKDLHTATFRDRLGSLVGELDIHRANNFVGAMLMHHTMQSTKFMSRWIEEKNK